MAEQAKENRSESLRETRKETPKVEETPKPEKRLEAARAGKRDRSFGDTAKLHEDAAEYSKRTNPVAAYLTEKANKSE